MKQLLTISELAQELKVKRSWVRSMIYKKRIPFLKIGRHVRFDKSNVEKWILDCNSEVTAGERGSHE